MMADGQYQRAADYAVELANQANYGAKRWTDPFVPAFDLRVTMATNGPVTGYSRSVDFATGVASVNWSDARGGFQRQLFVSRPDDVIVWRSRGRKRAQWIAICNYPCVSRRGREVGRRNRRSRTECEKRSLPPRMAG